ncbi:DUF1998 domain-containing protein [Streptomyces aidingensis]|uniref:MrfA-like Zn-binding domain-containing protein n=1 Tax=Streptomyces aidingensis TaxID=910347 RepID=A0A1I1TW40_9ACTN|nr:DUF1998 domain-containing protein [Streptomyces aidingensis]SFD62817.1 protein of unknown function [Streptomyces aidingensis]
MTPPPRSRRRFRGTEQALAYRKLGAVRRAQLITTYGVGSMIAIENESFIVAGLDSWNVRDAPVVRHRDLARDLKVTSFRLPPAPDENGGDGVRVHRFPFWYSCPKCRQLQPWHKFNSPRGRSVCPQCEEDLTPSRFVMACPRGHLDDFPYWKWVHRDHLPVEDGLCGGTLILTTSGSTASLRSIVVSCTCERVPAASMEGAFRTRALKDLGIRCRGRRPWLNGAPAEYCEARPRTLQRGSSAAWHPVVRSALSIPPDSGGVGNLLGPHLDKLLETPESSWVHFLNGAGLLDDHPYEYEDYARYLRAEARKGTEESEKGPTGGGLRKQFAKEYRSLLQHIPEEHSADRQDFVCVPPRGDDTQVAHEFGIDRTMLVTRLREVRALIAFTRVDLPNDEDDSSWADLSLHRQDWLPAIEVSGEGVFLRLDPERLRRWERLPGPVGRARRLRDSHMAVIAERAGAGKPVRPSPVSPRYVLLHTLAHVLINEWSLDGGYPAAALRERLYVSEGDDGMAGILIYTATSDSAGSLGGVVQQGEPERLALTLASALKRAEWCSMDPLCMESRAGGTDSLNLAACHACVLLPEVSCEALNSHLDRAMLVGTPDGKIPGYFGSWRGEN